MSKIAAGKDVSDTGASLNDVDKVLKKMNISLKDSSGQIRDLGDVLDEVASKWNTFSRNEQNQISTARLRVRQGIQQCIYKLTTLTAGRSLVL